nr:extensin family protein [Loktanella sp. F6476L]
MGRAVSLLLVCGIVWGGYQALYHPQTLLPRGWNPTLPLQVADDVTPITGWKLDRALASTQSCLAALEPAAQYTAMPDLGASDTCHITGRVELREVGDASLASIETRCAIGLRMAMWEEHALQPAARDLFGAQVSQIDHIGSYNCRRIRGSSERWSTHATANAIDVSGFRLDDGTRLRLINDWDDGGPKGAFLRRARDSACDWFRVTLSPDYNALHADHFHVQSSGWGLCR